MIPFRNQVIPMEVNERTALDNVLERIERALFQDKYNKNPDLALEIEGKLGSIKLKKESQRDSFNLLEQFSMQNFILLDDHDNSFPPLIKIEKNFESGVDQKVFYNILEYFRRVYEFAKYYTSESIEDFWKEYLANLKRETRENITIDYIVGQSGEKKKRLSYEIGKGLSYLEKENKAHFDLLHNSLKFLFILGNHLRLSINTEEKKNWKDYIGLLVNTRNIRVKHRAIFPYQFFEFHLTEVITIHENSPDFQELKSGKLFNTEELDRKLINYFGSSKPTTYEIEVEISDLGYLKQFLEPRDPFNFKSLFLRFLRNLESLYYGDKGMEEISYLQFFGKSVPRPIFGDYMTNEFLKHAKKIYKLKNK